MEITLASTRRDYLPMEITLASTRRDYLPMEIIAFDPSTVSTGWAIIDKGRLFSCGIIKAKNKSGMISAISAFRRSYLMRSSFHMCVVEDQQIYPDSPVNPNTILQVAQIAGACAMAPKYKQLLMPKPSLWNGSLPKHITKRRVMAALDTMGSLCEAKIMAKDYRKDDDLWDAIGIGLWAIRTTKRNTIKGSESR